MRYLYGTYAEPLRESSKVPKTKTILFNLDSAVGTVARRLKLMKMRWIFEKFPEIVFTHTVKEIF
ncbi:MAG: hypothetical protein A3E82_05925 [Gammaproteobacteria bacterium RIFCSPHIGHO2_12_FULL_38_11]|nr:MAG: hypothetical protein A3E82_05925 [Gammaproteobacteria bacterium RIFCSPHIGHO2_12_FULL_38_11]